MPSQILSFLYLGDKSDAKDKEELKRLGIKFVLNCTPTKKTDTVNGIPNYYEKENAFVYKRIPIFDNHGEDILSHMETAVRFIDESRHHGNILVHCRKGVSRSATFVIGFLMHNMDLTVEEATTYCKSIRRSVEPNASFAEQLKLYRRPSSAIEIGSGFTAVNSVVDGSTSSRNSNSNIGSVTTTTAVIISGPPVAAVATATGPVVYGPCPAAHNLPSSAAGTSACSLIGTPALSEPAADSPVDDLTDKETAVRSILNVEKSILETRTRTAASTAPAAPAAVTVCTTAAVADINDTASESIAADTIAFTATAARETGVEGKQGNEKDEGEEKHTMKRRKLEEEK